ncbi:MAG: hypothetical protein ACYDDF_10415 [Thermoplasmatota archaeon]
MALGTRALFAVGFLLVSIFAGCLSSGPSTSCSTGSACAAGGRVQGQSVAGLPNATFDESTNTTPIPSTLAAPPMWRIGEWWSVKVSDVYDGKSYESTRVVAGEEPASYLVGMPDTEFRTELMVLHMPGFGQVAKEDVSYDVHNCPFAPLKFPLTEGASWDTQFECVKIHAVAHVVNATLAVVNLTNSGGFHMLVTYDTNVQDITKIAYDNYGTVEVTGHGFGYKGVVTVPHMFRLVFQQARIGPGLNGNLTPSAPTETRVIDNTFERLSFAIILGPLAPLLHPGAPNEAVGFYQETVTAPNGTAFQLSMLPNEQGIKLAFYMVDKPGGTWKFQHIAAGPGIVEAEGVAYHVYNIDLPSGKVSMPLMAGSMSSMNGTATAGSVLVDSLPLPASS